MDLAHPRARATASRRGAPLVALALLAFPATAPAEDQHLAPDTAQRLFHLPFPAGKSYVCQRAAGGQVEPGEEHLLEAVDFSLPKGSSVVAVAEGRVVDVKEDSELSGTTEAFVGTANHVVLDHGGGVFTRYVHLEKGSVTVSEGEHVRAGQPIASSGDSGRTAGPKLRFLASDVWGRSQPVRFVELKGAGPVEKKPCLSKNEDTSKAPAQKKKSVSRFGPAKPAEPEPEPEPPAPPPPSELPPDAWSFNGIRLTSALPANVYELEWTYVITGTVDFDTTSVIFFVCKRGSTDAAATWVGTVNSEKKFSMVVRLAEKADVLGEGGLRYGFAAVRDGRFASAKLLPMVLVRPQ
jgi:murein DD-endopeptidase MepM/ murein hydrolase activator NlpD